MLLRSSRWAVLLVMVVPLAAWAEVRTWTDRQGKTMRAEFVRVHEGRVVLKSGTKSLLVPLNQLSPEDQKYIEGELNSKTLPGQDNQNDTTVRLWKDSRGNQIAAVYVRMDETQVVLSESGRPRLIPFVNLSGDDQQHIKERLRGEGQDELIATLDRAVEEAAAAAREAARQAAAAQAPSPFAGGASIPQLPRGPDIGEQMRAQAEASRQAMEARNQAAAQEREQAMQQLAETRRQMEEASRAAQQQRASEMQERMASLSSMTVGPTMVVEYRCSNCNKVVPDDVGAGGSCPHCGVYFEYSQSPTGQRTYASGSGANGSTSSESGRVRVTGRAIKGVIFLIVLIGGGVAALWKKITGA